MNGIADILQSQGFPVANGKETEEEKQARLKKTCELKCELFNNSSGNLNEKDGYDCKLCHNKGGSLKPSEYNGMFTEVYVPCKCIQIRAMLAKLERSGLKNIIKDYSFDRYIATDDWQKKIKETAIRFTKDDQNTWFFIGGMTGIGKTHLCTAIAAHYLRQNKNTRYMLWRDDVMSIKSKITDSEEYNKAITELKTAEVLYIDDFFKMGKDESGQVKPPTPADINLAYEVLNYRYNNKDLITIISSERSIYDIIGIDEAIGGRISEMTVKRGYYIGVKYDPQKNYRTKGIVEL